MFAVTGAEETLLQSVLETDAALTLSLLAHLGPLIALGCNVHLKEVFKKKEKIMEFYLVRGRRFSFLYKNAKKIPGGASAMRSSSSRAQIREQRAEIDIIV